MVREREDQQGNETNKFYNEKNGAGGEGIRWGQRESEIKGTIK